MEEAKPWDQDAAWVPWPILSPASLNEKLFYPSELRLPCVSMGTPMPLFKAIVSLSVSCPIKHSTQLDQSPWVISGGNQPYQTGGRKAHWLEWSRAHYRIQAEVKRLRFRPGDPGFTVAGSQSSPSSGHNPLWMTKRVFTHTLLISGRFTFPRERGLLFWVRWPGF